MKGMKAAALACFVSTGFVGIQVKKSLGPAAALYAMVELVSYQPQLDGATKGPGMLVGL
jgi:hypothetical protein